MERELSKCMCVLCAELWGTLTGSLKGQLFTWHHCRADKREYMHVLSPVCLLVSPVNCPPAFSSSGCCVHVCLKQSSTEREMMEQRDLRAERNRVTEQGSGVAERDRLMVPFTHWAASTAPAAQSCWCSVFWVGDSRVQLHRCGYKLHLILTTACTICWTAAWSCVYGHLMNARLIFTFLSALFWSPPTPMGKVSLFSC